MLRTAVLVSGGGTNLQAILDAKAAGKIPHADIALVIASNPAAYALERAKNAGIPGAVVQKAKGEKIEDYGDRLLKVLRENRISLCVLAGFTLGQIFGEVGIGTIITAFFMGPLIELFNKTVARPFLYGRKNRE